MTTTSKCQNLKSELTLRMQKSNVIIYVSKKVFISSIKLSPTVCLVHDFSVINHEGMVYCNHTCLLFIY